MNPTHTIVRGKRQSYMLAILLTLSVLLNIATPVFYAYRSLILDKVVILDRDTGSELITDLVDPMQSQGIMEEMVYLATASYWNRTPVGLTHSWMVEAMYEPDAARKVHADFDAVKDDYGRKSMETVADVKEYSVSKLGKLLTVTVSGQIRAHTMVDNHVEQMPIGFSMILKMERNPFLGQKGRYPLVCKDYQIIEPKKEELAIR